MLSLSFLGLLNVDAIVPCNRAQLAKPTSQLFKLIYLLVAELLGLPILLSKPRVLFSQVGQALSSVLDLLEHIWFALLDQIVKFLLSSQLIDL